jgi:hypothetical protein
MGSANSFCMNVELFWIGVIGLCTLEQVVKQPESDGSISTNSVNGAQSSAATLDFITIFLEKGDFNVCTDILRFEWSS